MTTTNGNTMIETNKKYIILALNGVLKNWLPSVARGVAAPHEIEAEMLYKAWVYRDMTFDGSEPLEKTSRTNRYQLMTCETLVIDDFGQEGSELSSFTAEAVSGVVSARCDRGLYTLITSRLPTFEAVLERMGDRAMHFGERMMEFGEIYR